MNKYILLQNVYLLNFIYPKHPNLAKLMRGLITLKLNLHVCLNK